MKLLTALLGMIVLLVACQKGTPTPLPPAHHPSVFEAVIADLVAKEAVNSKFAGSKAMVISGWNNGDSLFYSLDDELKISDELLEALQRAAESKEPFPDAEVFGPMALLTEEPPLDHFSYYKEDVAPVQAKCFVGFWRPSYSKDRKHAIVRAWYGPCPHDAVGTYLLEDSDSGWKVTGSTLTVYP